MVSFLSIRTYRSFTAQQLHRCLDLTLWCYMALFHPQCKILPLSNSTMFLKTYFFNLSGSAWVAIPPFSILTSFSNLVLSTNFLRVHSIPSYRLVVRTWSCISPASGSLRHLVSDQHRTGLHTKDRNSSSSPIKLILHAHFCPLIQPISYRFSVKETGYNILTTCRYFSLFMIIHNANS